jgi:hypothetical protein
VAIYVFNKKINDKNNKKIWITTVSLSGGVDEPGIGVP